MFLSLAAAICLLACTDMARYSIGAVFSRKAYDTLGVAEFRR